MSWADLLKSIVCVLNLIACVRLTGPYLIPKRSDREWSEARRRTGLYCRLAGWIGVFAYSYGLGHGLMHARDGWTGMASGVEVILLPIQILNLAIWTYLLVRSHGRSLEPLPCAISTRGYVGNMNHIRSQEGVVMDKKDSMTPDTIPQSTPVDGTVPAGRKNRRTVVIGVAAVAAVALVAGGVCGYRAYENHRVSMARQACQSAVTDLNKAVKSYEALLGADATTAALKTDATSVRDAKTLDALKQAAGAETPGMVKCDASDKIGLDAAAAKADKTAKGVKAAAKALESAVKAVESSKLDKTVADADGLYKATEGNVQDEKTREALKQAIAKRDAGAIAKAVKSVNDSKAAKEKADAEAKAKAEQEAQAQAAAEAAAQAQAQQSYSAPRQSYTPSYSGGSTSGGGSGSSVPDFVPSSGGYGVGSANDCDAACRAPIQH